MKIQPSQRPLIQSYCHNFICRRKHLFMWINQGTCQAAFHCSVLDGHPCQTYGLNISFPESNIYDTFQSVCSESSVILGSLKTNQSVYIEVWFDWRTSLMANANCRLWCSNINYIGSESSESVVRIFTLAILKIFEKYFTSVFLSFELFSSICFG